MNLSNYSFVSSLDERTVYDIIISNNSLDIRNLTIDEATKAINELESIFMMKIREIRRMRPADVYKKLNIRPTKIFILFEDSFSDVISISNVILEYRKTIFSTRHHLILNISKKELCDLNQKIHNDYYQELVEVLNIDLSGKVCVDLWYED